MIKIDSPFMVDFEITNNCPAKCFFCEANLKNTEILPQLSTEECFIILRKLFDAGTFGIFLTGGEPFSRKDLPELIKECFRLGLEPTVSTNGFYLNEKNIKTYILDTGLNHLQVSIHGHGATHDSIVGIDGIYNSILSNLEILVKNGIDIEVACVGLKENFESIPDLILDLASVGVKQFRILRYLTSHSKESLSHIPSKKVVLDLMPQIEKISKENDISLLSSFCPGISGELRRVYEGIHPMALTCPAGKTEFAILPNGDVYPCINLKDDASMYIGNIHYQDVKVLWNHPTMLKFRELTPDMYTGLCGNCNEKYLCYSARCVANNLTGDLYGDDISCYHIREKLGL